MYMWWNCRGIGSKFYRRALISQHKDGCASRAVEVKAWFTKGMKGTKDTKESRNLMLVLSVSFAFFVDRFDFGNGVGAA